MQSLLARLNIRCGNSSFGCTRVLKYELLERHENFQCKYLTQRCPKCMRRVYAVDLSEHLDIRGGCDDGPIQCTICQAYVENYLFRRHWNRCARDRLNNLVEQMLILRSISDSQQTLPFNGNDTNPEIFRTTMNSRQPNSPLETNLFGADAIRQARERGCGHLYHIILMLTFVLINYEIGLYLVCVLLCSGFVTFSHAVFATYGLIRRWITNNIYQGWLLIIFFSSLLSYGITLFFSLQQ
jgi:hypothetical protein